MLGRTHVSTSTVMGSAGLYGLYQLSEQTTLPAWFQTLTGSFLRWAGFPFDGSGWSSLSFWLVMCMIAVAFGALLPDVDSRRSILGRYVPFLQDMIGHRTITHTIWVVSFLVALGFLIDHMYFWMVVVGYILHIWQDSLSVQGVDFLWPFGKGYKVYSSGAMFKRGSHLTLYRVGGVVETIIFVLTLVGHVVLGWLWFQVF